MNTRSNLITIVPISETPPIEATSNNISTLKDIKYPNVNHQYNEKYGMSLFQVTFIKLTYVLGYFLTNV